MEEWQHPCKRWFLEYYSELTWNWRDYFSLIPYSSANLYASYQVVAASQWSKYHRSKAYQFPLTSMNAIIWRHAWPIPCKREEHVSERTRLYRSSPQFNPPFDVRTGKSYTTFSLTTPEMHSRSATDEICSYNVTVLQLGHKSDVCQNVIDILL